MEKPKMGSDSTTAAAAGEASPAAIRAGGSKATTSFSPPPLAAAAAAAAAAADASPVPKVASASSATVTASSASVTAGLLDAEALAAASPLAVVLSYWKDFDLENVRGTLDSQGLKIAEHQESSLRNRRKLAEATRDFKKADSEGKAQLFGSLLKAYQEEVDNLTKRAKFGENSFLGVYQKLYEAPDPTPTLASAADLSARLAEVEAENRKMRTELEEFRTEAAHVKNQQATVRRLEERNRQLEQQMEEKVKEMVAMRQQAMAEENQKGAEALRERENALQQQLRAARETVANMQRLHELGQSQLFELRAKSEEESEAKQCEVNLLTDEVERAQERLLSLEREKEALKSQLQAKQQRDEAATAAAGQEGQSDSIEGYPFPSASSQLTATTASILSGSSLASSSSFEASLRAKERMISELHVELSHVEAALSAERDAHVADMKRLNTALDEKDSLVSALESELRSRPTAQQVEGLKRQVKMLQAVGYNSIESEEWEDSVSSSSGGGDIGRLEALLLEKNRHLEHELTQLKMQLSAMSAEAEEAKQRVEELEVKGEEQKALIAKLEEDILKGYGASGMRVASDSNHERAAGGMASLLGPPP